MRAAVLLLACVAWIGQAQQRGPDKSVRQQIPKGSASFSWQVLDINNLWTWHRSDGDGNHSPGGEDGMGYPQFTARCIYEDNFVFGGIMYVGNWPENGGTKADYRPIRVNGGSYMSNPGMIQGWVEGSGSGANYTNSTNNPLARMFRIRRDYREMTYQELLRDASIINEQLSATSATMAMIEAMQSQYERDWIEWPVQYGAPFIDRNGNGVYDPPPLFDSNFTVDSLMAGNYDEPGVSAGPYAIPADQVLFTVYNGLDRSQSLRFAGSEPIGMEVQKTVWGYKVETELADHYFVRYRLINKGGVDVGAGVKGSFYIDSLFVAQWSDPDIGSAGDDLYGCDTVLHLAYAYNYEEEDRNYRSFALPPPSVGYTILEGPLVSAPADSGVFGFKRIYGKKNLSMTAFAPYKAGDPYGFPAYEDYDAGTGRWWFMFQGFPPNGSFTQGHINYNFPPGYPVTPFPFSGDPVTGTGFIDGLGNNYSSVGGDVRLLATSGPSRLAPGDTAEFVVGITVGLGADRLSSVSLLRTNVNLARKAFESSYEFARSPERPSVTASALDGQVILDWGTDPGKINRTETRIIAKTYQFEGYNVYQLPSKGSPIAEGLKIATFDIKNGVTKIRNVIFDPATGLTQLKTVQDGTDSGILRYLAVKRDMLGRYWEALHNGREYWFTVTAYNYTADTDRKIRSLESEAATVSVIPQIPFGVETTARSGDTLQIVRTSGKADGLLSAIVYDPLKSSGHSYEIRFDTAGTKRMIVKDLATSTDVYSASVAGATIAHVDGVQLMLVDRPKDFKQFLVTANALGPLIPPEMGAFAFNSSGFPFYSSGISANNDRPDGTRQQSSGLSSSQGWGIHAGGVGTDLSYTNFKKVVTNNDSTWNLILGNDFETRFTAAGGQARNDSTGAMMTVPFELWNVGPDSASPSDDYRMIPVVDDRNGNGAFDYDGVDHSISGGDNDPETDRISWYDPVNRSPGQAGYDAWVSSGGTAGMGSLVMTRMVLVLWNGGNISDPSFPANVPRQLPETGTTFRIVTMKPFGIDDRFAFTSPAAASGLSVAKTSSKRVGVYPNPYFAGWNYEGEAQTRNYVTFNNLPPRAKIRIFNLAGHLVRTLEKNDASQFFRWDLTNEHNWQIGSGIYICHVEMPDIGETKIIKLAVVLSEAPPTY